MADIENNNRTNWDNTNFDDTNRDQNRSNYSDSNRQHRANKHNNRHTRKPVWPWVLAGIVAIGLVWYLVADNNDGNNTQRESAYIESNDGYGGSLGSNGTMSDRDRARDDNSGNRGINNNKAQRTGIAEVGEFVEFVESDLKRSDIKDLDQSKIQQAFKHLTEATEATAVQVGYNSTNIESVRQRVENLAGTNTSNTSEIKKTAEIISTELANIQQSKFPDLNRKASQLQEATADIKANEPISDQAGEINDYLTQAADLLEEMDEIAIENER